MCLKCCVRIKVSFSGLFYTFTQLDLHCKSVPGTWNVDRGAIGFALNIWYYGLRVRVLVTKFRE